MLKDDWQAMNLGTQELLYVSFALIHGKPLTTTPAQAHQTHSHTFLPAEYFVHLSMD